MNAWGVMDMGMSSSESSVMEGVMVGWYWT